MAQECTPGVTLRLMKFLTALREKGHCREVRRSNIPQNGQRPTCPAISTTLTVMKLGERTCITRHLKPISRKTLCEPLDN